MTLQTEYQKRKETPCVPPNRYLNGAHCFWVADRDYDGRLSTFVTVWQWQPGAKSWCRPGHAGIGQNEKLLGYEILGICPHPLSKEETEELQKNLQNLSMRFGTKTETQITQEEFASIQNAFDALSKWVSLKDYSEQIYDLLARR